MNHLVVCLPPAAIFCELVAWRKTLLLISGLAVLTRDSGFKQNCTHTVRGCSLNYRWTCYKRNCHLHWINTWILVDLPPRLVHPLCCSLQAIMQKTPPPSVSILHSHAERLKSAVTLVDIDQDVHLTPKGGIFTLQRPLHRMQTYCRPVPAAPQCLAPSCLRDSHPILHTCTIFQFNKLELEMSHPRSAPRAFLVRFLTPFAIYLSFFCNLNESLLNLCSH